MSLLFRHLATRLALFALLASFIGPAFAHSSSNAYLSLSQRGSDLVLRTDINLRDVDLIFDLDDDRDGQVSWGETAGRIEELKAWMQQGITVRGTSAACELRPLDVLASPHSDGFYLSAEWTLACADPEDVAAKRLTLKYGLIFDQDNLHRGLLKVELPGATSSAILSPERPEALVAKADSSALRVFGRYVVEGIWHIWIGIDHILFLLSLLVLAPLLPSRQRVTRWRAVPQARPTVLDVLAVVTAFTLAHSITLGLSIMKWLEPPADLIEPAIALSVVLAALNNLIGWSALRRWRLAFVFGLVHGFGFANVLVDLGLPASALAAALGGFNVGVELGQLAIVLVFFPLAWLLRNTAFYRWVVVTGGSLTIAVLGTVWTLERTGLFTF